MNENISVTESANKAVVIRWGRKLGLDTEESNEETMFEKEMSDSCVLPPPDI